ncbi:MAG: oligosaccharide flippase family protein [Actinomycetota bacterium]|nr:oligosaccharide flippase family protein [Actinomycetota bacterium]
MQPERAITEQGAAQVFRAAVDLVGRLGLVTVLGAIATLAITRLLGPTGYGTYASAIATAALLGAAADLGFSLMLSRDAAGSPAAHRSMLRAAYEIAIAWAAVLTVILVALAFTADVASDRGMVLLVLAPSMLFNGLNPARTFMVIARRTRLLVLIDVCVITIQVGVSVLVAAQGLGPVAVAVAVSAGSIVNNLIVSVAVAKVLEPGSRERFSRRVLLARAAPLGVVSILTRVYLTIDLVLLGWLITGPRLGQYAAAAKVVTVLSAVSGAVMSGALPAMAVRVSDRRELERLIVRVWHWLVVVPLPVFVGLLLFAGPAVRLAFGARYAHASALLGILAGAGVVSVLSNLVGNLMVVFERNRALVIQNSIAIVFNVAGNLILVPQIGVVAAAWMTLATEVLVCTSAIVRLRGDLSLARLVTVSRRPVLALVVASAVALVLLDTPVVAVCASALSFLAVLSALGAWPAEFRLPRWASSGA